MEDATTSRSPTRVAVWALHLALPLLLLWLLLAAPDLDVRLEHGTAHFLLVLAIAVVNAALGFRISEEARQRQDARLFLVALAFLAAAGFIGLHALATPKVLVSGRSAGFMIASPVGLLLAAIFVAASSLDFTPRQARAVMRRQALLRYGLAGLMLAWLFLSLNELPPLNRPFGADAAEEPLAVILAVIGVPLYAIAAFRYWRLHRRRPAVVTVGLITAFALLGEALVNAALVENWRLSWWEWHVVALVAFGYIAYSANVHYRQEGRPRGLFTDIALQESLEAARREYGEALEALVAAIEGQERTGGHRSIEPVVRDLARRFDLSERQVDVLRRAADALAAERDRVRRLDALVAVGRESRVRLAEGELLARVLDIARQSFGRDRLRVGLLEDGRLRYSGELAEQTATREDVERTAAEALETLEASEVEPGEGSLITLPLTVKDRAVGVLEVYRERGTFAPADRSLLSSLASQLSVAVENTRLYGQLDDLLRSYLSPHVATALLADIRTAELGGRVIETTILFADLKGFTSFSDRVRDPHQVLELLNRYFATAVPIVLDEGGTVDKFVGDAFMALFNWPVSQPDHALRAARAALEIQDAIDGIAGEDEPRFRIGIYTGPALVGNVGTDQLRNFTAIGDAVNYAARLETNAEPGEVVIGSSTYQL
ncbi:MAG: adenylate/guanylate cyclase domain-containing protein, partial [Actinomycetota bacterium]|nr:adenylate/guanylate cyclase domain-containing protein [Actinomycetota bacterium]